MFFSEEISAEHGPSANTRTLNPCEIMMMEEYDVDQTLLVFHSFIPIFQESLHYHLDSEVKIII